jgi:hypothetical protein
MTNQNDADATRNTNLQRDQKGTLTQQYSGVRHTGIGAFSNTAIGTTEVHAFLSNRRFRFAYISADVNNTAIVSFGPQGGCIHQLNPGDIWPWFDIAPDDIYAVAVSGTQKLYFSGHGDPES